ncbi:MAG TPA: MBL fold metallo-hydrolase, partial [Tepidiformaceae bacterium]|nr:MBL fold metallo-hydrolase [Tepidiformaceae bacterium]
IVLEDAAEIQLEDADYLNRRERAPDEPPVRPLYTPAIARDTVRQFKTIPYARTTDLGNNIRFTFFDAGHILGSAWILLEWTEASHPRSLLFTADIGRHGTPIINDPVLPARPVDFVITESTYAGKTHAPMATAGHLLLECFQSIQQSRGRMIVPAFAVGRTQTILWYYARFVEDGLIDPFPVFVDSPMAVEVTHTYAGFPQFFDPETHALLTQQSQRKLPITLAGSSQQSREINSAKGPCLIIASSPTLEFGRVLHHVKISLERPQDLIAFVGWTPPYTLGRRIIEGQSRVRIFDRFYDVKCQRRTINGLSAHADGHELLAFLKPALAPHTRCFIVHGEPPRAEAMARLLHEAGATAIVPATQTCVIA